MYPKQQVAAYFFLKGVVYCMHDGLRRSGVLDMKHKLSCTFYCRTVFIFNACHVADMVQCHLIIYRHGAVLNMVQFHLIICNTLSIVT